MGLRILLVPMVFAGKVRVNILKFLFCFFYVSVLTDPVETLFFIAERHLIFYWRDQEVFLLFALALTGILTAIVWVIGRHEVWKERIRSIPVRYYAIGLALSFCA